MRMPNELWAKITSQWSPDIARCDIADQKRWRDNLGIFDCFDTARVQIGTKPRYMERSRRGFCPAVRQNRLIIIVFCIHKLCIEL